MHALLLPLVLAAGLPTRAADADLYRYWPRFPRPNTLILVPFVGDHEEGMVFETAAGLAADALLSGAKDRHGESGVLLYEQLDNSGYVRWGEAMRATVRPREVGPVDMWTAVRMLRERGLVRGYILYRYDTNDRPWHGAGPINESANVATSLAPLLHGIAVSERLEAKARELGLPCLADVRDRTEAWCLDEHEPEFSRRVVMTADPKSRVARSLAVALHAFVVSQPGPVYEAALARCEPDCPVLGWGCGGEDTQTLPSSEWGLFQTATNWCHNLPAYSTEEIGRTIPAAAVRLPTRCRASLRDLRWETNVHYVTFLMSDGDNVQWLMGNFAGGSEGRWYYESPARGAVGTARRERDGAVERGYRAGALGLPRPRRRGGFPCGWTFPYVDLAQLCPYVLADLFRRATPNEDFVLYGGGYYYPDRFGMRRPEDCLRLHAQRLGQYMALAGLRSLAFNAQDWDSPAAVAAYRTFAAEVPTLDGIFTVQYYPYSAGEGRILWVEGSLPVGAPFMAPGASGAVNRAPTASPASPRGSAYGTRCSVPIVSCRLCIWAQTGRPRDTTPAGVAQWLNRLPRGGPTWSDDCFTFVMPHAWSRFRDTHGDPSPTAEEEGVDQNADAEGVARGLLPVQWAVDRLADDVRVVTPGRLLLLVRLHLRTRETLTAYLAELWASQRRASGPRAAQLLAEAEALLPAVQDGDNSGRRCFELLQRADRLPAPLPSAEGTNSALRGR